MELVLLDRDGVLNEDRLESVTNPEHLVMLPRAAEAVARLNAANVRVAVVTNQAILGRGIIDEATLDRIHGKLAHELGLAGARVDAIFVAPDPPFAPTQRRKPGPGMLEEALHRFQASAGVTPMIGDSLRDLEAAAAAGCPRHLVRTGKGGLTEHDGFPDRVLPVVVHDDLWQAVDHLLAS